MGRIRCKQPEPFWPSGRKARLAFHPRQEWRDAAVVETDSPSSINSERHRGARCDCFRAVLGLGSILSAVQRDQKITLGEMRANGGPRRLSEAEVAAWATAFCLSGNPFGPVGAAELELKLLEIDLDPGWALRSLP